jgi:polyferredoxin
VPVLGIFFGKRWYCSWVCGCGGLANTFGEPWRHLSSKSSKSWKFERVSIYSVLGLASVLTALMFVSYAAGGANPRVAAFTVKYQTWYGLVVASLLAGVFGVGLYPLGGTRVWCRFFCPMAALLGIVQKAGRYRIAVKDDMCISCGLCSKYCEMGIDVRSYAQSNESFTRASCVGCGLCAEVCPRGVLRLENVSHRAQQLRLIQIERS